MPRLVWAGGVRLGGTVLTCDPTQAPPRGALSFVSSARQPLKWAADPARGRTLATGRTVALRRGLDGRVPSVLTASVGRPFALGRLRLELLPAGHLPGSAQLRLEHEEGSVSLYAGRIGGRAGRLVEPLQARRCDVLALAAPLLGRFLGAVPPREEVEASLVARISSAAGPVLLRSSLFEAAELVRLLGDQAELRLLAPRRLVQLLGAYSDERLLDRARLPRVWSGEPLLGSELRRPVLLLPRELAVESPSAVAVPTQLWVGEEALLEPGPDRFALVSDADLDAVVAHIEACEPRQVWLTTPLSDDALVTLQARSAAPVARLGPPEQMPLGLE